MNIMFDYQIFSATPSGSLYHFGIYGLQSYDPFGINDFLSTWKSELDIWDLTKWLSNPGDFQFYLRQWCDASGSYIDWIEFQIVLIIYLISPKTWNYINVGIKFFKITITQWIPAGSQDCRKLNNQHRLLIPKGSQVDWPATDTCHHNPPHLILVHKITTAIFGKSVKTS